MTRPVLLLGGTADARRLATELYTHGVELIYSIAGLVRTPDVNCEVVSGGFTQFGGLDRFIELRGIGGILDITHPYAAKMSNTAASVAQSQQLPCWRFDRPAWQPQAEDCWKGFGQWSELLAALESKQSVFLTAGQIPLPVMDTLAMFARQHGQKQLLRTAVMPKMPVPPGMQWIKGIGPFNTDNEREIFQQHNIDVLVSKNSGGASTVAKLDVARALGVPVLMLERPARVESRAKVRANTEFYFEELTACRDAVLQWFDVSAA
jgi:precorrin-6A/cobalt-precorrin-6A reductase